VTTTETEAHGPVDFLLLEFPRNRLTGEAGAALTDLVQYGVIRLYDLTVISKDNDGAVEVLELSDPASGVGGFSYFAGARSGLISDADMEEAAAAMRPDTVAALIIYENSWAIPFVTAARKSGGEVIASQRIPASDVIEALDSLELAH
jgi:dihydroorotase-like cyclic amidohydrolase